MSVLTNFQTVLQSLPRWRQDQESTANRSGPNVSRCARAAHVVRVVLATLAYVTLANLDPAQAQPIYVETSGLFEGNPAVAYDFGGGGAGATLPRYLPASDVERIIAACDPSTQGGCRDRAKRVQDEWYRGTAEKS